MRKIFYLAILLLLFSCDKETIISPTEKIDNIIYVGIDYQGGKVIYIFNKGEQGYIEGQTHGLIVSKNDQVGGVGTNWADAVKICTDLTLNNYNDWRLPSISELEIIKNYSYNLNINYMNWSSSVNPINSNEAFYFDFRENISILANKGQTFRVRAIRTF